MWHQTGYIKAPLISSTGGSFTFPQLQHPAPGTTSNILHNPTVYYNQF